MTTAEHAGAVEGAALGFQATVDCADPEGNEFCLQ